MRSKWIIEGSERVEVVFHKGERNGDLEVMMLDEI
jgi:hypothetical protein